MFNLVIAEGNADRLKECLAKQFLEDSYYLLINEVNV